MVNEKMTKEELIECIYEIDQKFKPEHLRRFKEEQLAQHLSILMTKRLKNTANKSGLLQLE